MGRAAPGGRALAILADGTRGQLAAGRVVCQSRGGPSASASSRGRVELGGKLGDATIDFVANPTHLVERAVFRVGQIPVEVALAGDERAVVAAPMVTTTSAC